MRIIDSARHFAKKQYRFREFFGTEWRSI